jgi:hypothetical protein
VKLDHIELRGGDDFCDQAFSGIDEQADELDPARGARAKRSSIGEREVAGAWGKDDEACVIGARGDRRLERGGGG